MWIEKIAKKRDCYGTFENLLWQWFSSKRQATAYFCQYFNKYLWDKNLWKNQEIKLLKLRKYLSDCYLFSLRKWWLQTYRFHWGNDGFFTFNTDIFTFWKTKRWQLDKFYITLKKTCSQAGCQQNWNANRTKDDKSKKKTKEFTFFEKGETFHFFYH